MQSLASAIAHSGDGHRTAQVKTMIIECVIVTDVAVYEFSVNQHCGIARVTKYVRKGYKGYDACTVLTVQGARKLAKQLLAK